MGRRFPPRSTHGSGSRQSTATPNRPIWAHSDDVPSSLSSKPSASTPLESRSILDDLPSPIVGESCRTTAAMLRSADLGKRFGSLVTKLLGLSPSKDSDVCHNDAHKKHTSLVRALKEASTSKNHI